MSILIFRPILVEFQGHKCFLRPFESFEDRDFLLGSFDISECIKIQGLDSSKLETKLPFVIPSDATVFLDRDIVEQDGSLLRRPNPKEIAWDTPLAAGDRVEFREVVSTPTYREIAADTSALNIHPKWNRDIKQLWLGNVLVKRYGSRAPTPRLSVNSTLAKEHTTAAVPCHMLQRELPEHVIKHIEADEGGERQLFLSPKRSYALRVGEMDRELYSKHVSADLPFEIMARRNKNTETESLKAYIFRFRRFRAFVFFVGFAAFLLLVGLSGKTTPRTSNAR